MPSRGDIQLAIGYWIVSHRSTLRKWWALVFMGTIVLSMLWMILFFSLFFSQESKINALVVHVVAGPGAFQTSVLQPQELTIGAVQVIARDATHADLVADLNNPNSAWAASTMVVHFILNDAALSPQTIFVNQESHRPIIAINNPVADSAKVQASLVIDSTTWSRASAAGLPAAKFTISNPTLQPSTSLVNGQSRTVVTVQAEVRNESVYNFYKVEVPVVLISGDRVVGAGKVSQERWATLTSRVISVTLDYPVLLTATVQIEPQVNRFDAGNTYR